MKPEWSSIIWFLVALVAIVVAIRGVVRFDVNEWLRDRRNNRKEKIKALCPHVRPTYIGEKQAVQSMFMSPPGTVAWQCQRCGMTTHDKAQVNEIARYWSENPRELLERLALIEKLSAKL